MAASQKRRCSSDILSALQVLYMITAEIARNRRKKRLSERFGGGEADRFNGQGATAAVGQQDEDRSLLAPTPERWPVCARWQRRAHTRQCERRGTPAPPGSSGHTSP